MSIVDIKNYSNCTGRLKSCIGALRAQVVHNGKMANGNGDAIADELDGVRSEFRGVYEDVGSLEANITADVSRLREKLAKLHADVERLFDS